MSKTLYIIDGHSHIYAAFYALRDLRSFSGEPTNATFGFLAMLLKLLRSKKPDMVVVAMDSKGPTFRHEQFADYNANRPAIPEAFARGRNEALACVGLLPRGAGLEQVERHVNH